MASNKTGDIVGHKVTFSITTVDTETEILHNLDRVPLEGFIWSRSSQAKIYRSSTAWTNAKIFLKASQAVTGTLLLI